MPVEKRPADPLPFRRSSVFCIALAAIGFLLFVAATTAQPKGDATAQLKPSHSEAVERWLAGRPHLRLATIADCLNEDGLAATREQNGESYHPYYAVGDFNRDKREDFAVVLVNKRKTKDKFAVAIFNGPLGKDSVPAYFEEGWDLSDGGLFDNGGGVMVGPFESDNCIILRPRRKTYVIVACIED